MSRRTLHLAFALALGLAPAALAEWVTAPITVRVGPWPSSGAPAVGELKRGDLVEVLEEKHGWVRISPYVSPEEEGLEGRRKVARWVWAGHLSKEEPAALPEASCGHPDIAPGALPTGGPGHGITIEEAALLCRGALYMLGTERCARVEYGDKSLSRPGSFFVNCGGDNLFFTEADLPGATEESKQPSDRAQPDPAP